MSYEVHKEEKGGLTLRIIQDEDAGDPRVDYDNAGIMVMFHRRMDLPNENGFDFDTCDGWSEMETVLRERYGATVILPVYMLDHSGVTYRTTPFGDVWDSGQVGFIYVTDAIIVKEWVIPGENNREWMQEHGYTDAKDVARACLIGEVETYDQWARGDVYGYVVEDEDGDTMDSCWGFYGQDSALEEGRAMLDSCLADRAEQAEKEAQNAREAAIMEIATVTA